MGTEAHACHSRPGRCANCGDATTRGRTCSAACARAWSADHIWSSARIATLARDGWQCVECGISDFEEVLEVHHLVPVDPVVGYGTSCRHHRSGLVTLCRPHHRQAHAALRTKPGDQLRLLVSA